MSRSRTSVLSLVLLVPLLSSCTGAAPSPSQKQSRSAPSPTGHSHTPAEPGEHADVYPDRITLTWAEDPASSLSVSWRTDTSVTAPVAEIAPATPASSFYTNARTVQATTHPLDIAGVDPDSVHAPYHYHSVTFSNLGADSTYAYRVGDGTHWSEWFHAMTASDQAEPFSFIYLGDAQNNLRSHWSRAIRAAYSADPDAAFMVHVGDLVNGADRNVEWARWHQAGDWIQSTIPTLPVPGNREYANRDSSWTLPDGSVSETPTTGRQLSAHWRPQFALPQNGPKGLTERVYVIDHQGLRLIGVDPMAAFADSVNLPRQTQWLESVLSDNDQRWTAVAIHIPVFSTVGDFEGLREAWKPLFDEYQVDLVMQGHNHTYARGQVRNQSAGNTPHRSGRGTVYVTSVAGAKMMEIKDGRWSSYEDIELDRGGENTQLFQVVRVSRDTLKYRAYTVMGDRYDAFDLVKRPGPEPNELIDRVPAEEAERTYDNTIPYDRPKQ